MALLRLLTLIFALALPGAALLSLPLGVWGMVMALAFAAAVILLHVFFHGPMVLAAHGARPIDEYSLAAGGAGALGIKPLVRRLSFKLGVPEPEMWMYVDVDPRLFSVGTRYRQRMAVSSGLLAVLNAEELEALLTRELLRFTHFRARRQPLYSALGCTFGRLLLPASHKGWIIPRVFLLSFLLPFLAVLMRVLRPHTKLILAVDDETARFLLDAAPLVTALRKMASQPESGSSLSLTVRLACGVLYPVPPREVRPWIQGWSQGFKELDFRDRIGRLMGWNGDSYA